MGEGRSHCQCPEPQCCPCCTQEEGWHHIWEVWAPGDGPELAVVTEPTPQCRDGLPAPGWEVPGVPHQLLQLQQGFFPGCLGGSRAPRGRGTTRHSPHPQTPPQASGASSLLPSWVLLFRWCFVSHITDVTSRRHRGAEMDLMSLCFLQLRKTSERLSLQHPEEPAGCSATASVPTGGQRTAKGAESKSRASETWGQHPGHSRTPLSSPDPATSHPPHRTRQVSPCCASHCSDSTRERGTGGAGAVPPRL